MLISEVTCKGRDTVDIFNLDSFDTSEEDVKELKLWLFREQVRLKAERKELDELYAKFMLDKESFKKEMDDLKKKMSRNSDTLKHQQDMVDKKLLMLENAYRQLDKDKQEFEKQKRIFEADREYANNHTKNYEVFDEEFSFFQGVNSSLALKKRYKDLIKIFHPDNMCGDKVTFQKIQKEYECLNALYMEK